MAKTLLLSAAPVSVAEIAGHGGSEVAGVGGATGSAMWSACASCASDVSVRTAAHAEVGPHAHHRYAVNAGDLGTVAGITHNC